MFPPSAVAGVHGGADGVLAGITLHIRRFGEDAMSESGHSATGYIVHHLTNLRFDLTHMKFLHGEETGVFGVFI
jgi:hypothetical protein